MQPGVAVCKSCGSVTTYSPTNCKDIVIQCSNAKCSRYICTIDCCYKTFPKPAPANNHQQDIHRANADLSKCFFCKTFKDRTTGKDSSQCPKCGIFWCLFNDCTYEAVKLMAVIAHMRQLKHNASLKP